MKQSSIPNAGFGLFAGKQFKEGEMITEHSGTQITRRNAEQLRCKGEHSHLKSVQLAMTVINGIKEPTLHEGAASFANDSKDGKQNAAFVTLYDGNTKEWFVALKSLCEISPGDEIFVAYDTSCFWDY